METIQIVATVAFSVVLLGVCSQVYRKCKKPAIKPSRSDNDLTSLNNEQEV